MIISSIIDGRVGYQLLEVERQQSRSKTVVHLQATDNLLNESAFFNKSLK